LGNPLNVTAQNTAFKVSEGLQKSHQGVSGCSAHPAETRWRFFDDVVQISDDWNLSTRQMKISPHFDANTILLYTKANQDISKFLSMIKSKEQCEQLRALLALDIRYLKAGCWWWGWWETWSLGHDYDILLHFAIPHMRRVDGALPGKQDGTKSLDLLVPTGEHKWVLFVYRADERQMYYCEPCCSQVLFLFAQDSHTTDGGSTL
jgi:hypothetical protein